MLRHRRLVAAFWLIVTVTGIASVGSATKAVNDQFSVPGREGYKTNAAIIRTFRDGGSGAPITPVSPIVGFLIALVGLGVAIDYSLLIVSRWREERAHGHLRRGGDRARDGDRGRAVVFSGSTVAIGLLGLIVVPVPFLRSVGYAGLVIPLISVAVATTLLPVILAKLGPRLDWPHLRSDDKASRAWTAWAKLVVRYRWAAAGAAVAVLAALVISVTSIQLGAANGNPNTLSQAGDTKAGLTALERSGIGAGVLSPIEILVRGGDPARFAQGLQGIAGVEGAAAPTGGSWRRNDMAVIDVLARGGSSATVDNVRAAAHRFGPDVQVGGIVAQNSDFISAGIRKLPADDRADRAAHLRAPGACLPLAAAANQGGVAQPPQRRGGRGVLTLVWQKGYGSHAIWGIPAAGSIPSWLPVIVFAFLFGLSMDYEVFILSRMREEYDSSGSTETAVVHGIGRTGRLVTSAALILFLGFVAMASAPSTQVKMIATGLSLARVLRIAPYRPSLSAPS